VQFKPKEAKTNTGDGGAADAAKDAATEPTALGGGEVTEAAAPVIGGGGDIAPANLPGSPTLTTRPTLENLGVGGPFPVIDPKTGKLDKALQDQLMTAFINVLMSMNDNPFLDEAAETKAFEDGATKGVQFLKDEISVDPTKVDALKGELAEALKDGKLSDAERTSLAEKLNEAGMSDVADAIEDGTATDEEIATLQEKIDGAAASKLEKDITTAMEDGKLTPEERKTIESRLGKDGLDALEKGIEDGTVTKEELEAIADGTRKGVDPKKDGDTPEGTTDAKDGADAAADGDKPDATKPTAAGDDAAVGAGDVKKTDGDATTDGDTKPEDAKPAGDTKPADAAADGDKPAEHPGAAVAA
jgi:hypothetical protein